jgi:hypothetical protein
MTKSKARKNPTAGLRKIRRKLAERGKVQEAPEPPPPPFPGHLNYGVHLEFLRAAVALLQMGSLEPVEYRVVVSALALVNRRVSRPILEHHRACCSTGWWSAQGTPLVVG